MGDGDREERGETEVQRTVFQVHTSLDAVSFSSPSSPPSSFLTHPLPLSRVCVPSPIPTPRVLLLVLARLPPVFSSASTHISVHLFPSFPSRRHRHPARHPREPSELSEPLWISPYATYWAQDVLRAVRERNLRAPGMNPVKRPVAFINIAVGAFIAPCVLVPIDPDIRFYLSLERLNLCRNSLKNFVKISESVNTD